MRLHITHVTALADVGPTLDALAAAVGAHPPAAALAEPVEHWTDACTLIWRRPWMALGADTYGSTLLAHLGVGNVLAGAERYPEIELDELAARRPGMVLLPTEPYAFKERHVAELSAAIPGAAVRIVDGEDLLWWGVRTPAALERLRDALVSPTSTPR